MPIIVNTPPDIIADETYDEEWKIIIEPEDAFLIPN